MKLNITRTWEYSQNQFLWVNDPDNPGGSIKNYWSCDGYKIEGFLPEDLIYSINPKLNINTAKTKIKVMLLMDLKKIGYTDNWNWELMSEELCVPSLMTSSSARKERTPINLQKAVEKAEFITVPVDINDFRELYFKGYIIAKDYNSYINPPNSTTINPGYIPKFFLKYYVEFESNNSGKDNKPIKNTQIFTIPIEYESFTDQFPYEKHNLNTKDLITIDQFGGIVYSSSQTIFAKQIIIKTNLSTASGVKVRIIATESIIVDPNVIISPDIELIIIKNPFKQLHPQPPKTNSTYVKDFCENNISGLTYQAKNWATFVMSDKSKDNKSKESKPIISSIIYPNPNTGIFNVEINDESKNEYNLILTDITGKQILSKHIPAGQTKTQIETHNLSNGIYMLIIKTNEKQTTQKVIINNP